MQDGLWDRGHREPWWPRGGGCPGISGDTESWGRGAQTPQSSPVGGGELRPPELTRGRPRAPLLTEVQQPPTPSFKPGDLGDAR